MKEKFTNKATIEGFLYEYELEEKTVQKRDSTMYGKPYITGSVKIATDDECLNVVTVTYRFVSPLTKTNKPNSTYNTLKKIMETGHTVLIDGKENATLVKADTAIALNDFVDSNDSEKIVSAKRCEGGFISIVNKIAENENDRNKFEVDMVINGLRMVEADEERNIPNDYLVVKGAIFDFKKAILPVEFSIEIPEGINYFEGLDPSVSNITFTKIWGNIVSQERTISVTTESAFSSPVIQSYTKTAHKWLISNAAKEPYDFGSEEVLTVEDLQKMIADREVHLAEVRKRNAEYLASKNSAPAVSSAANITNAPAAAGGFNF